MKCTLPFFIVVVFLCCSSRLFGQEDSSSVQHLNNLVSRFELGGSQHVITNVGIAFMRSNFVDSDHFGFNTNNIISYLSLETMVPYKQPLLVGCKWGIETINIGHVTSAGGFEIAFYKKGINSSVVLFPKIGFPLINGMLAYGFGIYVTNDLKKDIGRHRITLSYCFNHRSNKKLSSMLAKHKSISRN